MQTNIPTTTEILAIRKLGRSVDSRCVDWAVGMLEDGRDSPSLRVLAGESAPFNQFEMGDLVDRTLDELGFAQLRSRDKAARTFASVRVQQILDGHASMDVALADLKQLCIDDGHASMDVALADLKQLCIDLDYLQDIYDFYLLHFARDDLRHDDVQWYWPDANRENIDQIVVERCRTWLIENPAIA